MQKFGLFVFGILLLTIAGVGQAAAFQEGGCGAGDCRDCHTLDKAEAEAILKGVVSDIDGVAMSQVPGLWEITAVKNGRKIPVYIDFSKQYLISGSVIQLASRTDLTRERFISLNTIDPSTIPLEDAVVLGKPEAKNKIIVFDDPECAFCRKLHPEMNEVVKQRPDIAFFIKMYPLPMHPNARQKAQAIICAKSLQLLEDSLAGKELPPPSCETDQVDKNIELAHKLGIRSTPTLIFPDGRVIPGYKDAKTIIELLSKGGG